MVASLDSAASAACPPKKPALRSLAPRHAGPNVRSPASCRGRYRRARPSRITGQPVRSPAPRRHAKRIRYAGAFHVQVGAFMSQSEAENRLGMVQQRAIDLLDGHLPFTASFMKDDKEWYRARFAGFSKDDAQRTCAALKKRSLDCVVMARTSVSVAAEQDLLRLVDARREIGRSALVRVHLHHQPAMRLPDVLLARVAADAEHGVGLLGGSCGCCAPRAAPERPPARSTSGLSIAPARQAPIEIGLDHRGFRRAVTGGARASSSITSPSLSEDSVRPANRPERQVPSMCPLSWSSSISSLLGPDVRFLSRRLAGRAERAAKRRARRRRISARPNTASGMASGQRATQDEEPGCGEHRDAARLAQRRPRAVRGSARSKRAPGDKEKHEEPHNRRENTPWIRPSAELLEKTQGRAALRLVAEILERLAAAGGIDRDRCQKLAELPRRARVEPAIGAAREPGDLPEGALGLRLAALLEQEHRHADQPELARELRTAGRHPPPCSRRHRRAH